MKKKYYSVEKIKKLGCDINIIWGQKDNGKSYAVKNEIITDFLLNGKEFAFVRRFQDEIGELRVTRQFADYPISKASNGEFEKITAYRGDIYFGTAKEPKQVIAGHYFSIDNEQDYAGIQLPFLGNIFVDEFISRTYYLPNEPYHLTLLFSTLARDLRPKIWLCGNNVSKLNPYIAEWGLQKMINQERGTIFTAEVLDSNDIARLIAVERCGETGGENALIIGKHAKHIAKGADRIKEAPHLPNSVYTYHTHYLFIVEREKMLFLVRLFEDQAIGPFLYVEPKTSEIKENTRIMTDNLFRYGELISYGLTPITARENIIFELLQRGKIFYSDNTTARDFSNVIESFKHFNVFD